MPPKHITRDEMEALQKLLTEQHTVNMQQGALLEQHSQILASNSKTLEQILFCIKGSESMNIEGIIPAQKRFEKILMDLVEWKTQITFYITVITSKKIWRVLLYFVAICLLAYFMAKYGFWSVWVFLKRILE